MKIGPVERDENGDLVRFSSPVQTDSRSRLFPERLWYEFPHHVQSGNGLGMDAFATALLLLAMHLGEDLHIQGSVSRKLLRGLNTYQMVFNAWFPEQFRQIKIYPEDVHSAEPRQAAGTGVAFSGGVDSTFSLRSHLAHDGLDVTERITHGLFVHGFDIPFEDESVYAHWAGVYQDALAELGVELVQVRTNVRAFVDQLPWILTHGAALCSVALLFQGTLGRFYVPASSPYTDLEPWGSHPVLDPLLSTESLEVVHDGCLPRVEKIVALATWRPAQTWLRVCWENPSVRGNCCRCHNCLTTMTALELTGAFQAFVWFPDALDRVRVSRLVIPSEEFGEADALLAYCRKMNHRDLSHALGEALSRSRRRHRLQRLKDQVRQTTRKLATGER